MKRVRTKTNLQTVSEMPWTAIEFTSCLNRARNIEDEILKRCEECRFADQDVFAIKLALEEALVNAIKHGNKLDPCKHVKVRYRITPLRADVAIEDEGPGFNPANLPDPTLEENLEATHGRGILLMRV